MKLASQWFDERPTTINRKDWEQFIRDIQIDAHVDDEGRGQAKTVDRAYEALRLALEESRL
jgi:hypothetical protein